MRDTLSGRNVSCETYLRRRRRRRGHGGFHDGQRALVAGALRQQRAVRLVHGLPPQVAVRPRRPMPRRHPVQHVVMPHLLFDTQQNQ